MKIYPCILVCLNTHVVTWLLFVIIYMFVSLLLFYFISEGFFDLTSTLTWIIPVDYLSQQNIFPSRLSILVDYLSQQIIYPSRLSIPVDYLSQQIIFLSRLSIPVDYLSQQIIYLSRLSIPVDYLSQQIISYFTKLDIYVLSIFFQF